ncbi:lysophospholipid acyltransferase family protein [Limisphaera sp. VF-2]|jgi:1-acyl-sn-glycerol-3-phosphate acyltransferase|uniref:lysophospholipid acyltransferase family protein n=1 Tax=Limisphaera sp. VF-2 TaxID=3400418 RepID=UPI001763D9F6|nr:1-acyl-sn-glycerol-3-phosphate acyltransferase [Limisphaera sp.]
MSEPTRMDAFYRVGWLLCRGLFRWYFRWRVEHVDRVPRTGGVILAPNHASFLDPPLVGAALPRPVTYLARKSLFRFPPMGWLLRRCHCIPVDREAATPAGLRTLLQHLQAGAAVLLFPEGTRSADGRIHPAEAGLGLLVVRSAAPVVPVRICGTFEAYGRHLRWPRPRPVRIIFGTPMTFENLRQEARTADRVRLKAIYQEIAGQWLEAVRALGD